MAKYDTAWLNEGTGEVFSPKGRLVYPTLLEAKINRKFPNNPPKFSATLLIPKSANIDAIRKAIMDKASEAYGKDGKKIKSEDYPIQKTEDFEKLADHKDEFPFLLKCSASAEFGPVIFGPNAELFRGDANEVYGGRWAVIAGTPWAYPKDKKLGIGWNLNRVQLLDHADRIGSGRITTASGFEAADVATSNKKVENASEVFDDEMPF